jgi:hypothetical protein
LPTGGSVGLRPASKSGPPTIDVNIPGVNIDKFKFFAMIKTNSPVSLLSNLMEEFEDGYVGLWAVIKQVQRAFPADQPGDIRRKTLSLIWFLLKTGYIEAGFPTRDGRGFEAWQMKPFGVVNRIASEWKQPNPYPTIGEIVWFTTPSLRPPEVSLAAAGASARL